MNTQLISLLYSDPRIQRQVEGLAVGSTMKSLNNEIMGKLVFPLAETHEQELIVKYIETHSSFAKILNRQLQKLRHQKSGLMHDLLTGKVAVKV